MPPDALKEASFPQPAIILYKVQVCSFRQGKDVFSVLPLTFHIATGAEDSQFLAFEK